ncbi:MAG: hypothetical protein QM711_06080 [Micropruina sp.]|uniref:phage major capsid protein n=1 Tax=Micropruina sp. TaxID=2737536 RepID=UPI0039E2E356
MERTPEGLRASWRIVETREGDDALTEAAEGLRAGFSVELEPIVTRGGRIISGTLQAAGLVARPAFPSARLAAAEDAPVPDMGDDPAEPKAPDVVINGAELDDVESVEVTPDRIAITTKTPEPDPGPDNEEKTMTAAKVQNPALVAAKTEPEGVSAAKLFATAAAGFANLQSPAKMLAALADIVPADTLATTQPQYVGEVWDGVEYVRRFIPLFNHRDLTSATIKGWQFKDGKRPEVDLYTGNKADIPSNDVETEEVSGVIQRFAGGHDIDRVHKDFPNPEFWAAYFREMAESYAKKSDRYVRDVVKAIPTVANGGRVHLLNAAMPAGVPKALALVTKGALKLLNSDLEVMPTFALVTASYFEELMYTPQEQVLAYLSASLGLSGGEVSGFRLVPVPDGSMTVGGWNAQVLVGHKSALTVHELGGGAPIRVEAEAIAKGGVDEALFGYVGTLVENVKGIVAYDAPTAS